PASSVSTGSRLDSKNSKGLLPARGLHPAWAPQALLRIRKRMMTDPFRFDINEILRYLPHRYPFMLVDRVLECIPGASITALKNVTYNEPFFPGHFPGRPVMPGVMVIEALAQ